LKRQKPRKEKNQDKKITPRKNLNTRTNIIKTNPRIIDNRIPKKTIRIFKSY